MTSTSADVLPARERRSRRILWFMRAHAGDPMAVAATILLLIVGEPSFGKGTVQTVVDLDQI
ncbi:hypothetical protein AB9E26_35745, partial [Rhizobium leguminosarum]